jgi:hypothetical protein
MPFTASDFLPKTPEEQAKLDKQLAKLEVVKQKMIVGQLNSLVRALKKTP